jgi:hypothetical protein
MNIELTQAEAFYLIVELARATAVNAPNGLQQQQQRNAWSILNKLQDQYKREGKGE